MANRSVTFDKVKSISPVADSWMICVLLSCMWCVHDEFENKDCIIVDMLLIDSDGSKIQAKVYKMLFTNFLSDMHEGGVYVLRNFNVVPNTGSYKATNHPFTIVFQRKTIVTRTDPDVLHTIGLSPLSAAAIRELRYCYEYLLDMVGLLTDVSTEKEYVTTGVVHRFITLELTDHTRKLHPLLIEHRGGSYTANVVTDGQDIAHFVLLDDEVKYLVRKSCDALLDEVQLSMEPAADELPQIYNRFVGKSLLFKVENYCMFLDGVECYVVRRVSDDIDIIRMFQRMDRLVSPHEVDNWYRFAPLISPSNLQKHLEATCDATSIAGSSSTRAQGVMACSVVPGDVVGLPTPVECSMGVEKSVGENVKMWCKRSHGHD
ncbi:Nucleic acid-binding, OB-fold [Sesbania bispinosa]|nr:Nucleic acid-binding, OB-fold [Sesbania bispinosa]